MKKIIQIISICLLVIGCTSSQEEEIENTDLIIGSWKLTSIKAMGQEFINDCKAKDKIEVNANGVFSFTSHDEDNNCASQTNTGSWSKATGSNYTFTGGGDTQTFTLASNNTLTFSFVQDNENVVYSFTKQ